MLTRFPRWRQNDQAFVEQQNGGGEAHRGLPSPHGRRGPRAAVAAVRDHETVRQLLPAVV